MKAAIENAVVGLLPLKRAHKPVGRAIEEQAREVTAAAGGHASFIAWADAHPNWRFNLAEAPNELHGNVTALAEYVARSIIEELLDRQAAGDAHKR